MHNFFESSCYVVEEINNVGELHFCQELKNMFNFCSQCCYDSVVVKTWVLNCMHIIYALLYYGQTYSFAS